MDKESLFKDRLPQDDVLVPGFGTVRVRGLSRADALRVEAAPSTADKDRTILKYGVVVDDAQQLTDDDVKRWQKAWPAGDIDIIARRIAELSGMVEAADKEAYKSAGDEPDA